MVGLSIMNKAFYINGGAGRVLCSIPALEKYAESNEDFAIISEAWEELYHNSKILRDKVYSMYHKNVFEEVLKNKEIITPEPYRLNAYFNQKCNLIQAFDIIINGLEEIPETKKISLELNKTDQIFGHNLIEEVKEVTNKNKIVVFQPFGSSVKAEGKFIYDVSGRSFELSNVYEVINELVKSYGVIVMSQTPIPDLDKLGVAFPQGVGLNQWAGIINAADYFLGCDSMGQHIAHALDKPSTVVIGSTYPENISYPNNKKFTIIDNGKQKRKYSPIRLSFDVDVDRNNEDLMVLNSESVKNIVKSIKSSIGVSKITTNSLGRTTLENKTQFKSPAYINQPQPKLDKNILEESGFKKEVKKNSKKTIDTILELNDIK